MGEGTILTFKVIAYGGFKIDTISYGGVIQGQNLLYSYTLNTGAINSNNRIEVVLSSYTPQNPEVSTYDKVFQNDVSIETVSYGIVHGNENCKSFGIILWSSDFGSNITLNEAISSQNLGNGIYVLTGMKGRGSNNAAGFNIHGQFGIGIRNLPKLDADKNYYVKSYVVYGPDNEQVNYGSIQSFTVA